MIFAPAMRLERAAARLPGVLAGLAARLSLSLRPDKGGKALGNAGHLDKVVGHVDKKLEGQAEPVFDEARGEEDSLRGAEAGIAMADGAVAELDGVGGGDKILARVGDGKRNEVVGALAQRRSERGWNRSDEPLKIALRDTSFAPDGVMNPVVCGEHGDLGGNFVSRP